MIYVVVVNNTVLNGKAYLNKEKAEKICKEYNFDRGMGGYTFGFAKVNTIEVEENV